MNTVFDFTRLVNSRHSCRAFLAEEVAPPLLETIFSDAITAPSNCNTQPWLVHVASGRILRELSEILPQKFAAAELTPDFPYSGEYEGVYRDRQYAAARALYDALGIARQNKLARQRAFLDNFGFFGAPHAAFVFIPEPFGVREAADVGMFAQNLMLSMHARGVSSCAQTALSFLAQSIREHLGVPDSARLLFGISFGYANTQGKANACRTERAPLADLVSFHC
ncbi:MAG: nitroreductase [Parahaliea sp.]